MLDNDCDYDHDNDNEKTSSRPTIFAGTRRYVSYSHLDGGTYRFQVRGSNGDGVWNETGTALIITIVPPFWDMWWFKALVGIAGLAALWMLYRYRLKKLVEIERMRVRIAGQPVDLTPTEYRLLRHLAGQPGRPFSRNELIEAVWGYTSDIGSDRTVDVHIRHLREKLEEDAANPRWILTVRGVGYRFGG